MSSLAPRLLLHVLTDCAMSGGRSEEEMAAAALAGGATVVQLRRKDVAGDELVRIGRRLRALTRAAGALLIVNDDVEVALAIDADGAHVGQSDMPATRSRSLLGPHRLLGVSASTVEEAVHAAAAGADYIGFGPIFSTSSKSDASAPTGLVGLRAACHVVPTPIVAIGGITTQSVPGVIRAGATGIAVIAAVVAAPDMEEAARELRRAVEDAVREVKS